VYPYSGMRTSQHYNRLRRTRSVRTQSSALAQDVSHRHSVARGAAYWHMLANPWTTAGVRPPSLLPYPTALIRSQTRYAYTTSAGNTDLAIYINPGLGASANDSVTVERCKINFLQFTGAGVGSGTTRIADKNQVFLYGAAEQYRPIAMGVRLLNLTQADAVAGCVYGRLGLAAPGVAFPDPTIADVINSKGDQTALVRAWPENRELRFVWHPVTQDNSLFTNTTDVGPDSALGDVSLYHQRNAVIQLVCTSSAVQAIEVEVVTWYEYIPQEAFRDAFDVEMSVISSADMASATGAAGSAGNQRPGLARPVEVSSALGEAGITTRVTDAAIAAARTPFDAAEGVVRRASGAVDSVLGARSSPVRHVPRSRTRPRLVQ